VSYFAKSDQRRTAARSIEVVARDLPEKVEEPSRRYRGIVKSLRLDKGFGFLTTQKHGEIFFHKTGIAAGLAIADLSLDDEVEYRLGQNARGIAALDITRGNILERFVRAGEVVRGRFVSDYQGKGPHGVIPGIGAVMMLPEHFLDQSDWELLCEDDWVQFVVSKSGGSYYGDSVSRLTDEKTFEG
jgi:cold shock CspA family protein